MVYITMKRNSSRSSLFSADQLSHKAPTIDPAHLCRQTEAVLADASRLLPNDQFSPICLKLLRGLIRRAETESAHSQALFLGTICESVEKYHCGGELQVRALLLEVQCELNSNLLEEVGIKLEKAKHSLINTPYEYLLAKAFLLEERWMLAKGNQQAAATSLTRCLELTDAHTLEYMQAEGQVRREIVDHVILAHYEYYRLRQHKKPQEAVGSLGKAVMAARNSYGQGNPIVRGLQRVHLQQVQLLNSVDRLSNKSRALTEIVQFQHKRNLRTSAFYSWQDERIIAQLLRVRDGERQVLHEATYEIKLDIAKIKLLKGGEWLAIEEGKVAIVEDELLRALGAGPASQPAKEMTTRIEMRNLSRDLVIRKDEVSSSDEDQDGFPDLGNFKLMRVNRAQSSKKFKDNH